MCSSDLNTVAAAEHGIALLWSLARCVPQADASVKRGEWKRSKYVGVSVTGKTLAVIGFGKVGSEVGRRGKGLGMRVIAYDPYASAERAAALGVELVDFETALAQGDFFSLHMPLLDSTRNLINKEAMAKMKKGARIMNVARGGVIDEAALFEAIQSGHVAGAALDVFDKEPVDPSNPLLTLENVICTPHLGASTVEAQEDVAVEVADAVVAALKGELASTAVNAPMVPKEVLAELKPYVALSQGLGSAVVQLLKGDGGPSQLRVTYHSPRGDDLDTRLLRANVLKGILERFTDQSVNLVNADYLAEQYNIEVIETVVKSQGDALLSEMGVEVDAHSKFSGSVNDAGRIEVKGAVINGDAFITQVGKTDVEVALQDGVILTKQKDQPGVIAGVGGVLGSNNINVSFMTVGRKSPRTEAVMAVGVDDGVGEGVLSEIEEVKGIEEAIYLVF